jgi:hypothetical protein
MKADLTRNTFDPFKHYARVLLQQGRVQLDADWNEQAAILLCYLRTLGADVIGQAGGPANAYGFGISPVVFTPAVLNDFRIGLGRYYVDGILCEADTTPVAISVQSVTNNTAAVQVDRWTLDGAPLQAEQLVELFDDVRMPNVKPAFQPTIVQITNPQHAQMKLTLQASTAAALSGLSNAAAPKIGRVITYLTQPDYPAPDGEKLAANTEYLVYLDVWERLITYVQDDSIREVALEGPDTATRTKVVWQVKAVPGTVPAAGDGSPTADGSPCDKFKPKDPNFLATLLGPNRGRLKARAKQAGASTDPCTIPPDARYRGPANQLYRVEIHTGSRDAQDNPATPTFKWSRENGSVVYPIVSLTTGTGITTVTLENLGRDDRFTLAEGEWVEIQDDDSVLQNRAAPLLKVQSIDRPNLKVTLSGTPDAGVLQDFNKQGVTRHPLVRRWDHQAGDPAEGGLTLGADNAALVQEGQWLELENGVQIQFQILADANGTSLNQYHTSDYWQIPARTATGDVEWPTEQDAKGTAVPLAKPPDGVQHHFTPLAVVNVDSSNKVTLVGDCRKQFTPLSR